MVDTLIRAAVAATYHAIVVEIVSVCTCAPRPGYLGGYPNLEKSQFLL